MYLFAVKAYVRWVCHVYVSCINVYIVRNRRLLVRVINQERVRLVEIAGESLLKGKARLVIVDVIYWHISQTL